MLLADADSHRAREEAFLDDVDVFEKVVLVEDNRSLDAVEDLQGITDVFKLFTRKHVELGRRDLAEEVHLLSKDSSALVVHHLVEVVLVYCDDKGVSKCDHVVHPRARLPRILKAKFTKGASIYYCTYNCFQALQVVVLVAHQWEIVLSLIKSESRRAWLHKVFKSELGVVLRICTVRKAVVVVI